MQRLKELEIKMGDENSDFNMADMEELQNLIDLHRVRWDDVADAFVPAERA